jgi:flagellar hook-associated protein 2
MASSISSTSSTGSSTASSTASSSASTASSLASAAAPLLQASGLASGLDTTSIVNALIQADSGQLTTLQQKQSDYQVQISTLGTLVSQLQAFQTATNNLSTGGVVSIQPNATYSDFTTSGSAQAEGSYTIQVGALAQEAKMRSKSFTSAQDSTLVPSGNLQFSIDGTKTASIDTTGMTLADVAQAINQQIPGLNASVISTDSGYYLNVARSSTGFATTSAAALQVVSDPGLGLASTQTATNAQLTIDGLSVSRTSNTISDVIPGLTLNLTGDSNVQNNVTLAANSSGTEAALNTFVSAYNTLAQTLATQLAPDPSGQYGDTLIDHSTASMLQDEMQAMLSQVVVPTGSVRTLADLGLDLQQDGTLTLDTTTMDNAIQSNAGAANAIFSAAQTGIGATVTNLVNAETDTYDGSLVLQQQSLQSSISDMTNQETDIQSYLDDERQRLTAEFTNMESVISGYQSATSYLTQVENLKISS